MKENEEVEQDGFDSGLGSSANPILLPEIIVYGKRPLPWYKRAINGVGKFINDEIFLNKNNIRVKNAGKHPKAMDAVQEGGNIAGAVVVAPFAAYTAVQAAPVVMPVLRVAGQAMTPSTWIGGLSEAAGYTAPNWLLNGADFAATFHFANLARKEIQEKGLNWGTGINALLSLAPFTRDTLAIHGVANTLRRPMSAIGSVVDDFRAFRNTFSKPEVALAREFTRSVNNTKFINVPVEHVSHNGVTIGSGLNAASPTDVGFHFSPAGSPTTTRILRATRVPYVRTGTWTYTNNTKPMFVLDRGNWSYGFNPDLYTGLNPGTTTADNALALAQRNPNFVYTNAYEGGGAQSFMTVQPNSGLVLSKNTQVHPRVLLNKALRIAGPDEPYTLGQIMTEGSAIPENFDSGDLIGVPAYYLRGTLYDKAVKPYALRVRDMYQSDWYASRLRQYGYTEDQIRDIQGRLIRNLDNTTYVVSNDLPYDMLAATGNDGDQIVVGLNGMHSDHNSGHVIIHESGHAAETGVLEVNRVNKTITDMIREKVDMSKLTPTQKKDLEYFISSYDDGSTEFGGLIRNALTYMYEHNLTPEQYMSTPAYRREYDLLRVSDALGDDLMKSILELALSTIPIIAYGKTNKGQYS